MVQARLGLAKFAVEHGLYDRVIATTKFSYNAQPVNLNADGNERKNILRQESTATSWHRLQ